MNKKVSKKTKWKKCCYNCKFDLNCKYIQKRDYHNYFCEKFVFSYLCKSN